MIEPISVLESLKLHLPEFTLTRVQAEVQTWWQTGESRVVQVVVKFPEYQLLQEQIPTNRESAQMDLLNQDPWLPYNLQRSEFICDTAMSAAS